MLHGAEFQQNHMASHVEDKSISTDPATTVQGHDLKVQMHYSQRWGFIIAGAEAPEVRAILEEYGLQFWEPRRLYYLPGTRHHPRSRRVWEIMEQIAFRFDCLGIDWDLEKTTAAAIDSMTNVSH